MNEQNFKEKMIEDWQKTVKKLSAMKDNQKLKIFWFVAEQIVKFFAMKLIKKIYDYFFD